MGGFVAGIIVEKPIKVLQNTLQKGTRITFINDFITYIGLGYEETTPLFKLNGAVCKTNLSLKNDKLCRCKIAEDFDFGDGLVISPPAEISFEDGKPKFFLMGTKEKTWKFKGKEYKRGYFVPDKKGSFTEFEGDGDKSFAAVCMQ